MKITRLRPLSRQRGATAVEFAIVASITLLLLIGIAELGRVLFYMNSAAQATRVGARIAVVCDLGAPGVEEQMNRWLHLLQPENIVVAYNPSGCDQNSCESVTVSIAPGVNVDTLIPFLPAAFTVQIPPFTTTLPRESMDSTGNEQICS
jgi:Flp pilus assembly pilin Flp